MITVCKGCNTRHLIADNLGWSKHWGSGGFDGNSNIEEFMDDKGRGNEVNRVSKDVFNLEKILDIGADSETKSSLLSDDGITFE